MVTKINGLTVEQTVALEEPLTKIMATLGVKVLYVSESPLSSAACIHVTREED